MLGQGQAFDSHHGEQRLVMRAPLLDVVDHILPCFHPHSGQPHEERAQLDHVIPASTIRLNGMTFLGESVDDQIVDVVEGLRNLLVDFGRSLSRQRIHARFGIPLALGLHRRGSGKLLTLPGNDQPIAHNTGIAKPIFVVKFFSKTRKRVVLKGGHIECYTIVEFYGV